MRQRFSSNDTNILNALILFIWNRHSHYILSPSHDTDIFIKRHLCVHWTLSFQIGTGCLKYTECCLSNIIQILNIFYENINFNFITCNFLINKFSSLWLVVLQPQLKICRNYKEKCLTEVISLHSQQLKRKLINKL